jgi:RNA polymerase sigma-70 factor (ECF subfamily)
MTESGPESADGLLLTSRTDARAFAAAYRLLEGPVLGFFMKATGRPDLAADLMAETFARALESIDSFDAARGNAEQWVFGIARNVLGSSRRDGRVQSAARARLGLARLAVDDHAIETIERLTHAEQHATLQLAELPADQSRAIQARVVEDLDYAEIASEMACSEAVVRQRVSRGLRTLRARLAGEQ